VPGQSLGPEPEPGLERTAEDRENPLQAPTDVIVVGAGLVGVATAWRLQNHGHRVLIVDPGLRSNGGCNVGCNEGFGSDVATRLNGSQAALGVLMARVFHRSRGRAWRLRQHSLTLWEQWRRILDERGHPIPWRPGLLLLARDPAELDRQKELVNDPLRQGMGLELWSPSNLAELSPAGPDAVGGLFSEADGQLDAGVALHALLLDGIAAGLCHQSARAVALEPRGGGWRVQVEPGGVAEAPWVLLCTGVASGALLEPLGVLKPMEPVLGQALELERAPDNARSAPPEPLWNWPGAVVHGGINLIPRPDLPGGRRFWLGATLEPGQRGDPARLNTMRELAGAAPAWLGAAQELRRWEGLRCRPLGQPAPLLEQVAPGLLLLSGHYRNGVLLAPASADWALRWIAAAGPGS